jgi:hypothetical protein
MTFDLTDAKSEFNCLVCFAPLPELFTHIKDLFTHIKAKPDVGEVPQI